MDGFRQVGSSATTAEPGKFDQRFRYHVGAEYVIVAPGSGSRRPAFDHDRLAIALSSGAGPGPTGTPARADEPSAPD
ncbi:hypothetical protein [Actinomadura rugatobispora]|uniref:Uncharacterized protein n=1 Tax=Actinomadura rugatobispora TaxID=1994 RepID=A0ABW0ZQM4_9ACTN|nr:hypothetical protein GCM10010200_035150 [Actinomadura rugatobispora]